MNVEGALGGDIPIEVDLHDMSARPLEIDVREEGYVVRITVRLNCEFGRSRDDHLFAIRSENLHVRLELAVSHPMINNSELQKR